MTKDIAPELLANIRSSFEERYNQSEVIESVVKKAGSHQATYSDVHDYAVEVGQILSQSFDDHLQEEILPNGRMYYNIADRVIEPTMTNNYELVADLSGKIQEDLNQQGSLQIKNQKPALDHSRIRGIIDRVSMEEQFNAIKWILNEPIILFTQHIVDEAIRSNADFQAKSGLKPKIIRHANPGACEWCQKLAGSYRYGEEPRDVYRRHSHCRCKTEYFPGDGRRQDVWSKSWKSRKEQDKIEERIAFSQSHLRASGAKNYFRDTRNDRFLPDEYIKKEKHAYLEYDRIKNSDQELEKRKIYNNIGQFQEMRDFTKEDVDIAFDHIFNIEHELEDEKRLFAPDFDMAQSWNRLINNQNIQKHDLILLRHERLENDYMYKYGLNYSEAHEMTNKVYYYDVPLEKDE